MIKDPEKGRVGDKDVLSINTNRRLFMLNSLMCPTRIYIYYIHILNNLFYILARNPRLKIFEAKKVNLFYGC